MYKVFVNEKKLSFSTAILEEGKNLKFENSTTFEIAIDLLNHTSTPSVHVFSNDLEDTWAQFKAYYQNIEAAGGLVFNPEDEILFIYRLGKWDLPKGKMEKGESPEVTALREVTEECSISNLSIIDFIDTSYHMYKSRENKMILKIVYWYKMQHSSHETPQPQEIEGITKALWLPQSDIKSKIFPNTFQNIKMILENCLGH